MQPYYLYNSIPHQLMFTLHLQLIKPILSISITFSFSFLVFGKWNNIVEQKPIYRAIDGCMSVNFTFVAIWPTAYMRNKYVIRNVHTSGERWMGVKRWYRQWAKAHSRSIEIFPHPFGFLVEQSCSQLLIKCPHFAWFNKMLYENRIVGRHYAVLWLLCDFRNIHRTAKMIINSMLCSTLL